MILVKFFSATPGPPAEIRVPFGLSLSLQNDGRIIIEPDIRAVEPPLERVERTMTAVPLPL